MGKRIGWLLCDVGNGEWNCAKEEKDANLIHYIFDGMEGWPCQLPSAK